jgi:hypothetical protein
MPQTVMPADVRFARLSPDGDAGFLMPRLD